MRPKWLLDRVLLVAEDVAETNGEALPALLIEMLREHFGAQYVCIHFAEHGRLRPETRAALVGACPAAHDATPAVNAAADSESAGNAVAGSAAEARFWQYALESRKVVTASTTPAAIQDDLRPLLAAAGARDGMAIPLLYRGEAYAVANLYFKRTVPAKLATAQNVIRSVRLLGNLVYGALQQEYYAGALRASDGVALALAQAAAVRDGYADGHVAWVCALAEALAAAAGLSRVEQEAARKGAMLRDIGKLYVPDFILQKPGPLNAEERARVREHPATGARMLLEAGAGMAAPSETPALAAAAVRSHHERLDGSGYPDGLAGDAVPLLARIVAIVDVYAALTSDRPYRAALPETRAAHVLQEMAGPALDPALVSLFFSRCNPAAVTSENAAEAVASGVA